MRGQRGGVPWSLGVRRLSSDELEQRRRVAEEAARAAGASSEALLRDVVRVGQILPEIVSPCRD